MTAWNKVGGNVTTKWKKQLPKVFYKKDVLKIKENLTSIETIIIQILKRWFYKVYKDVIKFKTKSRKKTEKTQENGTLVFQKNRYKMH